MATHLGHGLLGFTRQRIGLRAPRDQYDWAKVTKASIHHGGPVGPPRMTFRAAASTIRGWQDFHMNDRKWDDLGYNLLIDGLGRVYQGRPVGAIPAAVGGHNTGMVGIVFMQDGRFHKLNAAQRRTLRKLFHFGIRKWGLPPLKNLDVKCHNEYEGHLRNECPGEHIKRHVSWRRTRR